MSVVVRCPNCRWSAPAAPEVVGQWVVCPRCHARFAAAVGPPPALPRAVPVTAPPNPDEQTHDLPESTAAPVSVLVGLGLLPFVLPLVWLAVPVAVGRAPTLSVATALALAVSASVLSVAVVFTLDWTAATRVKGVLVVVGLAYAAGVLLFFLDKPTIDWVKRAVGARQDWHEFQPPDLMYRVDMPGTPAPAEPPPLAGQKMKAFRAVETTNTEVYTFVVGHAPIEEKKGKEKETDADFFERARKDVEAAAGAAAGPGREVWERDHPGREWELTLPDGTPRVVRVYRADPRMYYLSAEGPDLTADTPDAVRLFGSFHIRPGK